MRNSCSPTSVLVLLYAFYAQAAFLPPTTSLSNRTLLGLPVVSVPAIFPAASVPPIPVSSRGIVLAFIERGRSIPEDEVKDTLIEADQAIADLAHNHPNQRITNDRFEYRRLNGKMLISITAFSGEEITWMELFRILQGLYHYMTNGMGAEETHYQTLEFEVEAKGQEKPNIGYGVVWYLDPEGGEVQKRATLPPPNLTILPPSIETPPWRPNTTLGLLGVENLQKPTLFPISKTLLTLSFYYFGPSIPARSVEATLQGAMAQIRPRLNGPSENDSIEHDAFRWILPLSREAGIPVAVSVFTYPGRRITWRQLFDVLFGLFGFATTFGTDLKESHYQVLGFRILDQDTTSRLGVGTISYFRPGTDQLAKRVGTPGHASYLRRPSTLNASSLDSMLSSPIRFPVVHTNVILTFTYLGQDLIPPEEIHLALMTAREGISTSVSRYPNRDIPERFGEISVSGRVATNILVYERHYLTWKELNNVLKGIQQFCLDESHDRLLVFEIDINTADRGRVGFGTLLYVPSEPTLVEKQALAAWD